MNLPPQRPLPSPRKLPARPNRPPTIRPPAATLQPKMSRPNWPPVFRPAAPAAVVPPADRIQRKAVAPLAAPGAGRPNWPPVYRATAPLPTVQPKFQLRPAVKPSAGPLAARQVYRSAVTAQRAPVIQRSAEASCDPFCCIRPIINWFTRPTPSYTRVVEMPTFYVAKSMTLSGSALTAAQNVATNHVVTPIDSNAAELNEALESWYEAASSSNAEDHVHMIKMVKSHKASHSAAVARDSDNTIQGVVLYKALGGDRVKLEDAVGNPTAKGVSKALLKHAPIR